MGMNNPGEGNPKNQEQRSAWKTLYSFLGSSRFGLFLLLAVGCISFLGMFILQNAPEEQYVSKYGAFWGRLVLATGFADVYSVWWYVLLVLLTTLNLVLCSLGRIKTNFRQAFSRPKADDSEDMTKPPGTKAAIESALLYEKIYETLRRRGFAVDRADKGSAKLIAARRGGVSRIGFIVTHLAVILVLVAGVVNGRLGYRYLRPINVGDSLRVSEIEPSANFSVRADDFTIDVTEDGKIRDYKSTLTVIENGKEVVTKVIEVNHPLTYKGISFYQASYGQRRDRIKEARILLTNDETSPTVVDVPFGETTPVPGTDMTVKITDYVPHFVKDLTTGIVSSRSDEPKLPAVRLEIARGGAVVDSGWLIMGMDIHSGKGELGRFHFEDYRPLLFTGIDVARNPGVPLMFTGFGVASVGICLSFFVGYKRIWVKILETGPGLSEVRIASVSPKNPLGAKGEIDSLLALVDRNSRPRERRDEC